MLTQDRVVHAQAFLTANLWLKITLKQNGLHMACCKGYSINIIGS